MPNRNPALRCLHHWPTRTLCIFLILVQAASVNWYLMENLDYSWAAMYAADAFVIALFVAAMIMATKNIHKEKHSKFFTTSDLRHSILTYVSWLVYAVILDVKIVVIFSEFSTDLDDVYFFGPNTLKTTLALSGIIFLTFLSTQHDLRHGKRKDLLIALTATVIFDILDGVDNLDNLFEKDTRDTYPPGLADVIIAVSCLNFILPTVPLLILAITKFGLRKLPKRLELLHKMTLAYVINLPLFITRMITWHGISQGISIFVLKNILVMCVTAFEVLEEHFTQDKEEKNESEGCQGHENHSDNNCARFSSLV